MMKARLTKQQVQIEESEIDEAWALAAKIASMGHIDRMRIFHEYEMRKIMERYSYEEAKLMIKEYYMEATHG